MKSPRTETCPLSNAPCRHCSIEKASGPVTLLKPDIHTGMLVRKADSFGVLVLGAWCNNDGRHWVEDLKVCPSTLKHTRPWVPWKQKRWGVSKLQDTKKHQRVEQVGQQKLRL